MELRLAFANGLFARHLRREEPGEHALLEVFDHRCLTARIAIASASPPAIINSTTEVPSPFGP